MPAKVYGSGKNEVQRLAGLAKFPDVSAGTREKWKHRELFANPKCHY